MMSPKIIKRKYSSGFKAEIILKPDFQQKFFGIIVDFGSGDVQKYPGLAHFLEHKLFAKKDGDISQKIEGLGADVNAFTSYNETMFYCNGINHQYQLIELLFQLVGEPYFTQKNVKQEIPIILQELAMYQDEPSWIVSNTIMQELFGDSNLGFDVAGTESSIKAIDAINLLAAYKQNYLPTKMRFVASGDFSEYQVQKILRIVDKLQTKYFINVKKDISQSIQAKGQMRDVILKTKESTEVNYFGVGIYFENLKKVLASRELAQTLVEIMLESKLGITSLWFDRMKKAGWLSNPLQISVSYTRQGDFATIYGVSNNSVEVIQAIKEELVKPITKEYIESAIKFFELQKKESLAEFMRSLNSVPTFAIEAIEADLDNEDSFTNLQNLQTLSYKKYCEYYFDTIKHSQICSTYLTKGTN